MPILYALLTGLLSGSLAGLLGIGGGMLFVPMMLLFFPQYGIHYAVATSCGFCIFSGLSSYITHSSKAKALPVGAILSGSILGALIGPWLTQNMAAANLARLFAVFVTVPYILRVIKLPIRRHPLTMFSSGLIIGTASSSLGIGGGALLVPLLTHGFHYDIRRSITTSALFIAINCGVATIGYTLHGAVIWQILLLAAPAGVLSARLASHLSHKLPPVIIRGSMLLLSGLIIFKMLTIA